MNRLISLLAAFAIIFGAFPSAVFASPDGGSDLYSQSSCKDGTYSCGCTSPSATVSSQASSVTSSANACDEFCNTSHGSSFSLTCTYGDGTTNHTVAQGNVGSTKSTTTTAENGSKDKDFIIPVLNVKIPGFKEFTSPVKSQNGTYTTINFLGEYINAIYGWALGAGALVAVVMMMLGGLQYVLSRGKAKYIEKAKKRITNAITGIVLLFAAYTIGFLIDPSTTTLQSLEILTIHELPDDSIVEYGDGVTPSGDLFKSSKWQTCMLNTFGKDEAEVKKQLVEVKYDGKTYAAHRLIARDLQGAFDDIAAANLNYTITSIGTYNWRANRNNSSSLSFHSWGVALDINPGTNPNCPKGETCKYDMPQQIVDIFKKHNFGWGGNWKSLKDYMHFSTKNFCGGSR